MMTKLILLPPPPPPLPLPLPVLLPLPLPLLSPIRCEYSKTCQLLVSLFDQSAAGYQELLQAPSPPPQQMALREGKQAHHYNVWQLQKLAISLLIIHFMCMIEQTSTHHTCVTVPSRKRTYVLIVLLHL